MEVTLGGISQVFTLGCVLLGSLYLTAQGEMTTDQLMLLWGGILSGMGIGYANGRKS